MKDIIREVKLVADIHGFSKLKDIKMIDKTRYSALIGQTGTKILVDIESKHVWQWFPFRQRLILQPRRPGRQKDGENKI
ncbi:hypothetical protein [Enterococcus sp. AZ103]|uniref:hypothetical protein n=1 Tax=Enterococcus sp. AZ103 TaxID=2774628 RepID=UPI003F1EC3C1